MNTPTTGKVFVIPHQRQSGFRYILNIERVMMLTVGLHRGKTCCFQTL